jgi:hypothetical protein
MSTTYPTPGSAGVLTHEAGINPETGNVFSDRRAPRPEGRSGGPERRQFTTTPSLMRPEVAELAEAVDRYKMEHRRRFITFEELFNVMSSLGYHK